ncbi:MAG TPA: type II toxin-antitoxin system RelE/ParE family toxin [Planctomycetota bacterium]|nr:type II toxin-antitoxin system RelE/ParE family toxin [Planctomycetota bacterium]
MPYKINYSPLAVENLRGFRAFDQALIKETIDTHLKHEPKKESKSRIKHLRGFTQPEYRLRVGDDIRVIYDVSVECVTIHAIVRKEDVDDWLLRYGVKS